MLTFLDMQLHCDENWGWRNEQCFMYGEDSNDYKVTWRRKMWADKEVLFKVGQALAGHSNRRRSGTRHHGFRSDLRQAAGS